MKSYELLVFDWDGTLMDSAGEIVGSMQQAIQDTGLPERTPAQMRELIGLGLNDVLARLFPELDTRKVRARLDDYRRRYGMQRSRAVLFPSVIATLDVLRDRDFTLAVATGKSRRGLDDALASSGTRICSRPRAAPTNPCPPVPDMLEDILLRTATLPERALMIGDTEYDVSMDARPASIPWRRLGRARAERLARAARSRCWTASRRCRPARSAAAGKARQD